jgi:hypothetical protein
VPHGLIRFAEHHDGVIAQRMVISADHVSLRASMSGKSAGNQQRRESYGERVQFHCAILLV